MPLSNVHIYREMRCFFPKIEAVDAESAAKVAEQKTTDQAKYTEDSGAPARGPATIAWRTKRTCRAMVENYFGEKHIK